MRAAVLIAAKDLRLRVRDRSAFIVGFIVPFGLATIFSLILGGVDGDVSFRYVVADEDGGELGAVFVEQVLPDVEQASGIEVASVDGAPAAERAVEAGDADAAFVVPEGFSDAVMAGRTASIEVIGSQASTIGTAVARSVAAGFADRLSAAQLAVATVVASAPDADPTEVAGRAGDMQSAIELTQLETTGKQLSNTTFYAAGMAVFFLFFTTQFGVTGLLEERRDGTLSRLLAAPVGRWSIVGAKALTSLVLGIISMTVLIAATAVLLGADWGDPVGVAGLVVAGVVSAVGIMALVATVARTPEQANAWQSVIAVVFGLFGGVFFPVAQGPGLLADLSLLTPHRWFMRGMEELAGGGGLTAVLPAMAVMTAFGLVAGTIGSAFMRRVVRP